MLQKDTGVKSNNRSAYHDEVRDEILLELCKEFPKFLRLWSQPTGAAYRRGKLVKFGTKGSADISGILAGGYRIEIEVKTGSAKQSSKQKDFEAMIKSFDGFYLVVRSADDAINQMRKLLATLPS